MVKLSRKEIESHSSSLTNIRINEHFKLINSAELNATGVYKPTVQDAIAYHSVLLTLYMETSNLMQVNDEIKVKVEKLVKKGEEQMREMKSKDPKTVIQQDVEESITNSKQLRFVLQQGLQNLNYFFRIGKHDPKGISESLKLFEGSDKKNESNKS